MADAVLTINSRNYGAWSMRSWLLCRLSGIDFDVAVVDADDPQTRAELLQLSPSFLVPFLEVDGFQVWDTLAIAEVLHERHPEAGLLPSETPVRAHCRSVCGELHSGFHNLRSSMPMNIKRRYTDFKVWSGVQCDIDRVTAVWADCLAAYEGPWLFGRRPTAADAMFAPECTRFRTYAVSVRAEAQHYVDTVLGCPEVQEWVAGAIEEEDMLLDLEGDF